MGGESLSMTVLMKGWNYQNDSLKSILSSMYLWVSCLCQLVLPSLPAGPERGRQSICSHSRSHRKCPLSYEIIRQKYPGFSPCSLSTICILSSLHWKPSWSKGQHWFMTFLGESINILNRCAQKIGQKSCTQNKRYEAKGPETLKSSCVQLKETSLGFLEDCHFHFLFELKHAH